MRDDGQAESLQSPPQGPTHRAQPDQPGGLAGEFPGPEPLVRNRPGAVDLAGTDVAVSGQQFAVKGKKERHRQLGHRVSVPPGAVEHGYPGGGGCGHVNIHRIAAGCRHSQERALEYVTADGIDFHNQDVRRFGFDPVQQLRRRVHPQGCVFDPRVIDHVRHRSQTVEAGAPQWGGDVGTRPVPFGHPDILAIL